LQAQDQFHEGYLVTSSNDTLKGFISTKDNVKAKAIKFKRLLTDESEVHSLSMFQTLYLKEYNEYYSSLSIEVDKKPNRTNELETSPARRMVKETILLKKIVGGKINLLFYKDENNKEHFFVQHDGTTEELGFVTYLSTKGLVELPYYIETLKVLTKDCEKVRINKPRYKESTLSPIIAAYNSCYKDDQYVTKKEKLKLESGVILGGSSARFDYNGPDYASGSNNYTGAYYYKGVSSVAFKAAISGFGGIYLNASGKRSTKMTLGLELLLQNSGNFVGTQEDPFYYSRYSANFSYLSTSLNLKGRLINARRISLYAKIGVGGNYLVNYTAEAYIKDKVANATASQKTFMTFEPLGVNFYGGIGATVKKVFIELRFRRDVFYGAGLETAKLTGANFLVGYKVF
jgi:hypothetical protein